MTLITLEPFSSRNAALVLQWRNQDKVRRNSIDDEVISEDKHRQFLEKLARDPTRRYFVVRLRDEPVGVITFVDLGSEAVTWGCYIGGDAVIPGLFIGMAFVAADYAFERHNAARLLSEVAEHNNGPQQLNRFLGIESTGTRTCRRASGASLVLLQYDLKRLDWPRIKARALSRLPQSIRAMVQDYRVLDDHE